MLPDQSTEFLSLMVKIFTAASAVGGILALGLSYFNVELYQLSPRSLAIVGAGFIGFSLVIGVADLIQDRAKDKSQMEIVQNPAPGPTNSSSVGNIGGNVNAPIIQNSPFRDLIIQPGDSEEVQRQKRDNAERLVAGVIAGNLVALDRRLELVNAALVPDDFARQLAETRQRIAPGTAEQNADGYRRLIAANRAGSLRQAINSEKLHSDLPGPLMQTLLDAQASGSAIRDFLGQLGEVDRVTEALLSNLERQAGQQMASEADAALGNEQLLFDLERLKTYTQGAHLDGLRALDGLGTAAQQEAASKLAQLQHLQPRQPIGQGEYYNLRNAVAEEMVRLNDWRQRLITEQEGRRNADLERLAQLEALLRIDQTDSWQTVVAKAKSLRDLGRTGDAIAAYARYGEMFAESDQGAGSYASAAQEFTRQFTALGMRGGVYLFAVIDGGAGNHAGLAVGDIITGYSGAPVTSVPELAEAMRKSTTDEVVRIEYLRLMPNGIFNRRTATAPGGQLGLGMMPI